MNGFSLRGGASVLIALGWLAVPRAVSARDNGWTKYAGNPVMGSPELGTCFDLNVVPWGSAKYNNYFSWRSQSSIALSRSEDGIHWTAPVKCLEPDPSSGWEDRINRASVWFKDGTYHMWYCGQARGYTRIGYATSKDGVRFTRMSRQPVMISERPHEGFSVMNPYVRWDEGRQAWRMWYASGETYEPNVLCYAESKDGFRWEKSPLNPVFVKGSGWDRDRVGGCEVHPLPDGRWIMFYIGYSDIHTARIGAAVSADGITGWTRLKANPLVEPTPGEWDSDACYKPSVVRENDRWLLWYNGRTASREYIGLVEHKGLDLGPLDVPHNRVLKEELVRRRFDRFALDDEELYVNAFPNRGTVWGIGRQIPLFECPDEDIERTYYFRWWTYRKHLRRTKDGKGWVVTEFLPDVSWAGAENTISCPFGHHVREGRWIRNPEYLDSYIDFMLKKGNVNGPRAYVSWPAWCALERAKVTGDLDFVKAHLDDFVCNYEEWSKGWMTKGLSLKDVENAQGAKGVPIKAGFRGERGLFDIAGDREGSEFALSYDGARPMVNAAMWAEATAIAEIARASGNRTMANLFAKRAAELEQNIKARLWNADQRFFTSLSVDGRLDDVCELHGYAPFYFGMELKGCESAWRLLTDAQGFNAPKGLTFPARNTAGFDLSIDLRRHECLWNGPSWPYATSVALTALYGSLQRGDSLPVGAEDFAALVHQYAAQQVLTRPDGHVVPWIDENLDPMTGEWIARRHMIEWDRQGVRKLAYRERGKDYNHSTFCDLVIAGVCGFVPQSDGAVVVKPLAPKSWDWWCVDGILYHGHDITVLYDRDGTRYGRGTGLIVMQDGIRVNEGASERKITLWEKGSMPCVNPNPNPESSAERTRDHVLFTYNVSEPTMTFFKAKKGSGRSPAFIVCPGGGYQSLAWNKEGTEIADWLNGLGCSAFVLKYRVPGNPDGAFCDMQRAMGLVRSRAGEFEIDSTRLGVIGFSAGGNLAARLACNWAKRFYSAVDDADGFDCRPDMVMLVYPWSLVKGEDKERVLPLELRPDFVVPPNAPPIFVVQAMDDQFHVENSLAFAAAAKVAGAECELHVFPEGAHGFGLRSRKSSVSAWRGLAESWLARQLSK